MCFSARKDTKKTSNYLMKNLKKEYICNIGERNFQMLSEMKRSALYFVAAALWGIPGVIITVKGVNAYLSMPLRESWWLMSGTAVVLMCFFFMFRKAVDKYSALIAAQPEKTSIWHTFPLRGWILILFMLCLGMALKFIPGIPLEFTASFYSGLGPMLLFASARFLRHNQYPTN